MSYLKCEEAAADLVMNLFISNHGTRHSYHNLLHTIKVVSHTKEIASFYQVNQPTLCMLLMAAWFHDVGYLDNPIAQPEQKSILIMRGYLQAQAVMPDLVEQACRYIRAIETGPHLSCLAEKIICDAVTYDYGTDHFRESNFYLPQDAIDLLSNHVYYTEYCQLRLNRSKFGNIQWLRSLCSS